MSKVYSFRLDGDNPREAQAREIINAWVSEGYSLRRIITDALIGYRGSGDSVNKWDRVYDQLSELIRGIDSGVLKKELFDINTTISPEFVAAIKKAARRGIVSD